MGTLYILALVFASAILFFAKFLFHKKQRRLITKPVSEIIHPEWSRNSVIYEVNIRQYSEEGTFKALEKDLFRIKNLGVDVLWLMPVNPIGIKNRKEALGSYYSVRDYYAINPEFGNMEDFKALVKRIHETGLRIVLDWVPNHSSWDNPLVFSHPEFYKKDSKGKMISPFDWTDVVQFDYNNVELKKYMISAMKWWLIETDIDGFRCDVAHMVPKDFWNDARHELDKVKKILFIAESDQPFLHERAFDVSYDWKFHHLMNHIANGKKNANHIEKHFAWVDKTYPTDSYLMQFTSNHDENSWSGTEFERMGSGAKAFAVLAAAVPGIMMVYNGQEVGFNGRLKFFEKDAIRWQDNGMNSFYQKLICLKRTNKALFNGDTGGKMLRVLTNKNRSVYAFIREANDSRIFVIINLSRKGQKITIKDEITSGNYKEWFTNKEEFFKTGSQVKLQPWEFRVYE